MTLTTASQAIEGPKYDVIKSEDGVELRKYAAFIVAEVTVEAKSMDQASSKGFRPLAGYIFGGNTASDKIAMTSPVTTKKAGSQKIEMTAPVTTKATESGSYIVRFSMPSKWTLDTLPIPKNDKVKLFEVPSEMHIAHRFKGRKNKKSLQASEEAVLNFATNNKLKITSSPIVAGYDGPFTLPGNRRWEVMMKVEG